MTSKTIDLIRRLSVLSIRYKNSGPICCQQMTCQPHFRQSFVDHGLYSRLNFYLLGHPFLIQNQTFFMESERNSPAPISTTHSQFNNQMAAVMYRRRKYVNHLVCKSSRTRQSRRATHPHQAKQAHECEFILTCPQKKTRAHKLSLWKRLKRPAGEAKKMTRKRRREMGI